MCVCVWGGGGGGGGGGGSNLALIASGSAGETSLALGDLHIASLFVLLYSCVINEELILVEKEKDECVFIYTDRIFQEKLP